MTTGIRIHIGLQELGYKKHRTTGTRIQELQELEYKKQRTTGTRIQET